MENDEPPFTLERAWEDLKEAVGWILSIFGAPAQLAARRILNAKARQDILRWLAPIEAMARRILLLAALQLPTPNLPERGRQRVEPLQSAMRDAPPPAIPENPADWRVVFSDWPQGSGRTAGVSARATRRGSAPALPVCSAYPLARRIEALIRLARDPSQCIQRMARKIAARRANVCAAFARYRHNALPVRTLLEAVQAQVDAVVWNTS